MKTARPSGVRPASASRRLKHPVVLVVDDEAAIRLGVKMLLEHRLGAKVIEAASNAQALRAAKNRTFDLVISDYGRAGGDGLEFLREFKSRYPATPVIMHTAQLARIRQRARRLGASACLQKMMALPRLRIIARVLSAHR